MQGLSKKEMEIVSWLEFYKKYFFTSEEVDKFAKNKAQRYNIIKSLAKKNRIVKINKTKYYLIPIKAKSGTWSEPNFILADEVCNGKEYYIGGWAAANYWKITDQIPMQVDVYTTRRQGKTTILNTRIVFHRTTRKRIENAVSGEIEGHAFRILNKEDTKKWIKSER